MSQSLVATDHHMRVDLVSSRPRKDVVRRNKVIRDDRARDASVSRGSSLERSISRVGNSSPVLLSNQGPSVSAI